MNTEQISSSPLSSTPRTPSNTGPVHLAGYELTTLLGTGGYGEVWKAIGPGGFPKAVKVLHGRRDGEQAGAELKALNRMRELRHPFLLSIERVEVCNNRLIVVTELADANLTQHFDACLKNGLCGIPRDELLCYLREAADALDFMSEEHGLQHLDIKPDNLLLQGKHIKLGDFGMAKDISVTNVSMINGFTPLYAAPELFEGRPGRFSDQYSLAIVFQSLLTGKMPFTGRNAAQLTSQHLRSQPDLSALDAPDRPVVARALAKNPSSRFANCREFVQELIDRSGRGKSGRSMQPAAIAPSVASTRPPGNIGRGTLATQQDLEPSKPFQPAVLETNGCTLRPTLFIGVGGLAGQVLRQVKGIWRQQDSADVPAWQVLAIDTDPESLRSVQGLDPATQLTDVEALPIPLRSSKAYRDARNLDLSWLSRRWLFNIPRSCRVEGMRPLARLAVQDHLDVLKSRIRDRIAAVLECDAVLQSAAVAKLPFAENTLDVIVVAGTSGGTGSGSLSDIGLVARQLVSEFPGVTFNVNGVLLHSTSRQQRVDGIQIANTMACLKELRLQSIDGMGLPKGFSRDASELRPFDTTWLFHGGDQLENADFRQLEMNVARFLVNTTTTSAATAWREGNAAAEIPREDPTIRLIGTATVDSDVYSMAEAEAASLASSVLDRWSESSGANDDQILPVEDYVHELLTSLNLTTATLPNRILTELQGDSGKQIEDVVRSMLERFKHVQGTVACGQLLSQEFAGSSSAEGAMLLRRLEDQLHRRLNRECESAQSKIRSMVIDAMEAAGASSVSKTLEMVRTELLAARDCCTELSREIDLAFQTLRSGAEASQERTVVQTLCRQYSVLSCSRSVYRLFGESIQQLLSWLDEIKTDAGTILQAIKASRQLLGTLHSVHNGVPEPVVSAFRSYITDDDQLRLRHIAGQGFEPPTFASRLLDSATRFLLAAGKKESSASESFPASAWPALRGLGGNHRVLAWINESAGPDRWKSRLNDEFGSCVSVFPTSSSHVTALCETQNVESARILKYLQVEYPSAWEMAGRIHTRTDIQW